MDNLIIFCAKYLIVLPVLVLAGFGLKQSAKMRWQLGWALGFSVVIAGLADKIGGKLYYDPRPFVSHHLTPLIKHAADNGFPSEHTLLAATIATVIYFYDRRLGCYLGLVALAIGVARIAAHVHSPIDIIGSFLISALSGWAGYRLALRLKSVS